MPGRPSVPAGGGSSPRRSPTSRTPTSAGGASRSTAPRPGPAIGSGKNSASLFGYRLKSMPQLRLVGEVHRAESVPRRSGRRDTARATRGPSGPNATYVMTCTPSRSIVRDAGVLDAAVVRPALPRPVRREHDADAAPPPPARRRRPPPRRAHARVVPCATTRGSRYSRPSGPCPLAGLSTPSASSGSSGSGAITMPSRRRARWISTVTGRLSP